MAQQEIEELRTLIDAADVAWSVFINDRCCTSTETATEELQRARFKELTGKALIAIRVGRRRANQSK